ncbi:unnamed protein product [Dibothriocephalus latus]|uniref:Uncharacterized protein n=1 Tax=Dibothriocephalus latus TaxID=60516 RepID=A0A3P6RBC0_DIBLA|nr:unnamed protein product [Dibothriocephalus latus]
MDVGALPSVWGTSEAVRAMLELAHFRGLVKSNSEFQVLEDISSNLMQTQIAYACGAHTPDYRSATGRKHDSQS